MVIQSAEDLRTEIRALAEHEPDPARITHKILTSLSAEEALIVAQVSLMEYVRRYIANPVRPTESTHEHTYQSRDGRRSPSAATAAIRDWVAAELRRSVNVAVDGREWKFQGDCTYADCEAAEVNRERKSAEVKAEAQRWRAKKLAIAEHGVEMLRELPRDVLEELLKR